MKENVIYCAKCKEEMKEILLPKYEYEQGMPLRHVAAYSCPECHKFFFTENQAKEMEARTNGLKECQFGFERKLTVSGRSLVLGIPKALVTHLQLKQGQKVKIFPMSIEGFLIRKVK